MNKRFISTLLCLLLLLTYATPALGAKTLSNFSPLQTYQGEFTDVLPSAWYHAHVKSVYERGLMEGKPDGLFDPDGLLTLAETIKIAALLHKGYHDGSMDFPVGSPWYEPYLDYAAKHDITVGVYRNLNAAATRSDFALIMAGALPEEAITPINKITDGSIPDVWESFSFGQAVYTLYRAGILTGSDGDGTFFPGRTIRRSEAAAIISRFVDANTRVSFTIAGNLTAEQVYKLASPAVFYIEVLDEEGATTKTGSGFFISESGIAATNYHVVVGASSLRLTLDNGETVDATEIYDFNRRNDTALIQVEGEGFPFLELADSASLQTGATVYALGSPLGLQASFSKGIVSQSTRWVKDLNADFIQLDAAISSGSSGGALLDALGRVVGVTAATASRGQNINLAVPINAFKELSLVRSVTLESLLLPVAFYKDFDAVPDFGAFFDVKLFSTSFETVGTSFSYRVSDLPRDAERIIDDYAHILEQNNFEQTGTMDRGEHTVWFFFNSNLRIVVSYGVEVIDGTEVIKVTVSE